MAEPLKVLIVEDSPGDAELLARELRRHGFEPSWKRVDSAAGLREALEAEPRWDIVLADYTMPGFDGVRALGICHEYDPNTPFIVVSGTIGEKVAVECMRAGAGDYFLKGNLALLGSAVTRELREAEGRRARQRAEQRLRERNTFIEAILGNLPVGVAVTGRDGLEYMNRRFEEIHGWPRSALATREDYARHVFPGTSSPAGLMSVNDGDGSADEPRQSVWDALRIVTASGEERVVNIKRISLIGQKLAIFVVEDVTEQARVHDALREAKQAAEQANRAKSEFLANISHEIRTPLNGVIGMTDLILETSLTSEQQDFAETVQRSAETLLSLLNDVLDFSKIEAGRLDLDKIDFDLRVMIDEVIGILGYRAESKGLELSCYVEPGVTPFLHGDPGRLRQILVNLAGNAVKFTEQGEVVVRVASEAETSQSVRLRFEVTDTGIGIPPDRVEEMFEPFQQGDSSMTRRFGGTGLGLSITKRLVGLMGGSLGVTSAPGRGSRFWFELELARQGRKAETPAAAAPALSGVRTLVVDDNETNRRMLAALLESWGCRHQEVPGGEEALEALRAGVEGDDPFQLAVLDLVMPGMDGEAVACEIKRDPQLAETVLVAMPSAGRRGDAARLGQLGFAGYLPKPLRAGYLRDCLRAVLGREDGAAGRIAPMVTRHSIEEQRRGRARVLLAEDSPINQKVLLALLGKLNCHTEAVASGRQALRALESTTYDLVLMDCQMPDMDGYETTRQIRNPHSRVRNHAVPIVAVTAHAIKGDREKCLEAGMDGYVAKPITLSSLAAVVEKWCRGAPRE